MTEGTVGFIGLGLMGQGFTRRLAGKGYRVVGFDIDAAKTRAASEWAVTPANSAAEVAQACDIILVSVIDPAGIKSAVEDVALGPNGIVAAGRGEGKILVDHSTTDLETTQRIASALGARCGMMFVDAPVSGGPGAGRERWRSWLAVPRRRSPASRRSCAIS